MTISKADWAAEQSRLEGVVEVAKEKLAESQQYLNTFKQQVRKTNKEMWEGLKLTPEDAEDYEVMTTGYLFLAERKRQIVTFDYYRTLAHRMNRVVSSPYFGRIDFVEKGRETLEDIYIGITTLIDDKTKDCLVYDWRASVSSMFYDYELGPAKYTCPIGQIDGELLLKRQFKIANGEIKFMFDTNIKIDDEILQTILSQNTTGKMKNIITTIQREQNAIIRDEGHKLLIVQGAAGSGKTSIALHRIAYLLYTYRNTINSDNILIFSPNMVFSDYISNVLPELGEENMQQLTFAQYAEKSLNIPHARVMEIEDVNAQLEYFFTTPKKSQEYQARVKGTQFKSSREFVEVIKKYIGYLEEKGPSFENLVFEDENILSVEEFAELWERFNRLPFEKRLSKIRKKGLRLISALKKKRIRAYRESLGTRKNSLWDMKLRDYFFKIRKALKPVKRQLIQMLSYNIYDLYLALWQDLELFSKMVSGGKGPDDLEAIASETINSIESDHIAYEDVAPLLYLKRALEGEYPFAHNIKHVFVDEAQDYSVFHYEIIQQLFPKSSFTILGDLNQSIHPYMGIGDYQKIVEIVKEDAELVQLTKSYRSTTEITEFARAILGSANKMSGMQNAVERSGEKPFVFKVETDQLKQALIEDIITLQEKGVNSIAIICKTAAESKQIFELVRNDVKISLINTEDLDFEHGTVVVPSYLAKGLEFDAVLLYTSDDANYTEDGETYLLYTVCTRALHYLHIYVRGELSPLLAHVDSKFFELHQGQVLL